MKPECELVQVVTQMGVADSAVMGAAQPPFDEGHHTVQHCFRERS